MNEGKYGKKFIAAVAALIFWAAAPVNVGNIIKIAKDINIGDEQKVDNAIADSIQANKAKSFFRVLLAP
jgi:hypothetical protein